MTWNVRMGSALVAAAMLAATAACGGGSDSSSAGGGSGCEFGPTDDAAWSQTLEDAASDGGLNWYTIFSPDQVTRVIDAFEEVCPAVKITETATGAAMLPLVESQVASGGDGADVFIWGDEEWFKAHPDDVAELSGPYGSEYPEASFPLPGKAASVFTNPQGFLMWNTQEFPDGFSDFTELTDPKLKGRIGMREDVTTVYIGFLKFMEDTFGPDYLPALAKNDPKFYPSAYVVPQAVASGEIGVANIATVGAAKSLKDKGAPIDYMIPEDSYSAVATMGVLAESKRPAAAKVFSEWLMSPEGQEAVVGDGEGASALEGIEGSLDLSDTFTLKAASITPEVRAEWTKKFEQIFRAG